MHLNLATHKAVASFPIGVVGALTLVACGGGGGGSATATPRSRLHKRAEALLTPC
jgi:hypothetical protein